MNTQEKTMKIDHINIVVTDLDESIKFFKCLGFNEQESSILEGEWISTVVGLPDVKARYVKMALPNDHVFLELIQYYNPKGNADPDLGKPNQIGFRHMALRVTDIEKTVENLKKENIKFLSDVRIFEKIGKKIVYFTGLDGIILELAQYRDK